MRLIVVDDSTVICRIFSGLIAEMKGIDLIGMAEDVPGAVEAILAQKPDAVVLDISLSGGTGIEVLEHIREAQQRCVVIMLTNYPYPEYRGACMQAGADYFFDKTYEFHKVFAVLKRLAASQRPGIGRAS